MNAKKILAILVLTFTMVALLASCFPDVQDNHEHEYTNWNIQTSPTEENPGTALGTCTCGETEEKEIPALTDADVWTKEVTPATHTSAGSIVYTSTYGTVEIALEIIAHEWNYTLTAEPTEDAEGQAEKSCKCGATETVAVPALSDASVWSGEVTSAPSHLAEGEKVYTSELYGTVKVVLPKNEDHSYGAWTVITAPTEIEKGIAKHTCECGDEEVVEVPAFIDTSVWSSKVTVEPTHTAEGEKVYTSELYGSYTVAVPKTDDHSYGEWTITADPTETATGTAERKCICNDVDTAIVPVLTDATVWTATVTTPATYNAAGVMTYSSIYGTVEAAITKLVAPYDGKTYTNLVFDGELEDSNKVVVAQDTWSNATLTLDANGFGFCTSYPYRGFTQITMVDAATGRIDITIYDITTDEEGNSVPNSESYITYPAYVDFETGIIVRTRNATFDYVVLYTPFEAEPSSDSAVASSWNGDAMAITYTANDIAYNVFCTTEKAYIGVSFTDMAGAAVTADACYNAPYVYVKDAAGNAIASYGYDGAKQTALDGYEGSYANTENGELFLSGFGTLTLNGVSGTYTVDNDGVNVYLNDDNGNVAYYYLAVLDGDAYTIEMPMVNVSFVTGGYAEQAPIEFNKNVPQTLPTYTNPTMTFKGWFYDEACTQPVEATFIPTSDITLYAQWKAKVVINLIGTVGDDANVIYLGEGDVIGDFLPTYGLDEVNYRRFVAWYVDANGNGELDGEDFALDLETTIGAEDTGATVIAKWDNLPAYYGTYYGSEI